MAKKEKEKPVLNFDGKKYLIEDMTEKQTILANQTADLENKISSMRFNLEQLTVGHEAFVSKLRDAFAEPEEVEAEA